MKFATRNFLRSGFSRVALAAVAVLGSATASQAEFAVRIYEDSVLKYSDSTSNGGTLTFSGTANTSNFDLSGFTLTSTSNDNTTAAALTGSGIIKFVGSSESTLKILFSDDNFTTPGGTFDLYSSASYTADNTVPGNTYQFQNFANAGADLFGMTVPTLGHTFDLATHDGNFDEDPVSFSSSLPFTLTQQVVFKGSVMNSTLNTTVSSVAIATSAVPEPGSIVLLGMGLTGVAGVLRPRKVAR